MKRKTVAILMGMMLMVTPAAVLAEEEAETEASGTAEEAPDMEDLSETIMGQVTELTEKSITITVTSGAGFAMPSVDGQESDSEGAEDEEDGEDSAGAENETEAAEEAEEQTITLTEETQYLRSGGSTDFSSLFSSFAQSMGEDFSEEADGEIPEQPDGDISELPDGDSFELPDDFSMSDVEAEEITFEDLAVGDFVMITLDDNGDAATVTVQSVEFDEKASEEVDTSDENEGDSETDAEE